MKGLLVKDFKLMMTQKNFFFLILVIVIGMMVFTDDISFPLSFLTFVISLFTLSTLSYDEFDNGNAFLFTLPITRTGYVIEKYCLSLILGCGSLFFAIILGTVAMILRGTLSITDLMMILPVMIVIQAIMLPFQIKFGGEKGRIAIIGAIGIGVLIGVIVVKGARAIFNIDIANIFNTLPTVSMGMLVVVAIVIALAILLVSMKISISIMNKKEF